MSQEVLARAPTGSEISMKQIAQVARELAMDIYPLPEILTHVGISQEQFEQFKDSRAFQNALASEVSAWNSALNTGERVKLKSASMIEAWLPELYARLHDRGESLTAKVEAGKLAARLAGLGSERIDQGPRETFKVTINMGAEKEVKFEKVIEHDVDVDDQ